MCQTDTPNQLQPSSAAVKYEEANSYTSSAATSSLSSTDTDDSCSTGSIPQPHPIGAGGPAFEDVCQPTLQLHFQHVSYWLTGTAAGWRERIKHLKSWRQQHSSTAERHGPLGNGCHTLQLHARCQHTAQLRHHPAGKQLLCDVSGVAASGRLLAVMGPSGAGKTTLLSVLAGERDMFTSGRVTGHVLLGGHERQLVDFRRASAHVRQEDALLSTTTPREALVFAAALRLPSPAYTQQERAAAVDELLQGMRLNKCADTLVGDAVAGLKGLSGGERRRLSVAVELLGRPELAFLDEPSSGQDSSTAQQVISFIRQRIISPHSSSSSRPPGILVITLHQPGCEITSLIDDLLLLAPGGRVAYCGPWASALHYFEQHLQLRPPVHTGLAEWYLSLLTDSPAALESGHSKEALTEQDSHSNSSSRIGAVRDIDSASEFSQLVKHSSGFPTLADAWQAFTAADETSSRSNLANSHYSQQQWLHSLQDSSKPAADALSTSTSSGQHQLVVRVVADDDDSADACRTPGSCTHTSSMGRQLELPSRSDSSCNVSSAASSCNAQHSVLPAAAADARQAGFWVQVRTLAGRNLRFWWRSPAMVLSEATQYLFVVLFLGSVYPRISLHGQSAAVDRLAVLFMWVTALLVTAPSRALICWDTERRLLRRELASGAYSLPAFLVGTKLLITIPLEACLVTLAGTILYFMLGLQATAAKFGAYLALSVMCAVSSSNVGNMIGLLSPDLNLALPILAVSATLLLAFAGFMVSIVPVWWSWLHEVSFASYAYAGLVRNEFEGLQLQLTASDAVEAASGSLGSNSMVVAAQKALQAAVATAHGVASNLISVGAAANNTLAVDGLAVVPSTIKVRLTTVAGFIGYMGVFAAGTTVLCVACTAVLVRVKMR